MSVLIGIVKRQGDSVKKSEIDTLYEAAQRVVHYSHREVFHRNAAFSSLHTYGSEMPFYCEEEGILFATQGKIDNRSELFQLLDLKEESDDIISDEMLIFHMFLKFREETPNMMLGNWSLAAYDFQEEKLFLAQDPFAATALYYYIDSDTVIFSNIIKPLLKSEHVPKTLNLEKIIEREGSLKAGEKDATVYKAIKLLGPAHRMWVDTAKYHKERYWFPEKLPVRRDIRAEDAAVELKAIFTEAVRCRLRSKKPVASTLSGGLDSGSVSVMASELLKQEGAKLHTFSHVPFFDIHNDTRSAYTFGDERPNIEATVSHNGNIIPHYFDSAGLTPLEGIRNLLQIADEPIPIASNAYWLMDLMTQVREGNFGVLMNGQMGNGTISWRGYEQGLNARQLLKRYGIKAVFRHKLYNPLIYGYIKPLVQALFYNDDWKSHCYLSTEFAKKVNLQEKLRQRRRMNFINFLLPPREMQLELLKIGYTPQLTTGALFAYHFGFEYSDPTADKRIVEFILQMPNEVFINESGESKQLLKRMMKDLLPEKVLFDKRNGKQSADMMERIQADIPEIESIIRSFSTDLCEEEIFDKSRLLYDLDQVKQKKSSFKQLHFILRTVVTMEFLNQHKKMTA
ncbi:MAG: asparagine synthase-related protein [Sulfuricurvum sp.]|jgi:asparagine synthase (glutamine-hydrolysing)|uniref:asparagine synthase-related protein n=1 Tax=Sulfuricurvum sp. TaxID=2025608 RepID=UPI0025EEB968|nr:asparagine synthase-related protein [Sulfuricurvum sp.]MCK9372319.1 asparagine synthase-related protein [Sulfuricurvum sp.]